METETTGEAAESGATAAAWPRTIGIIGAVAFALTGVGALVVPESFFDAVATFEPYNQHFIQDIGAFNLGIGATLGLATRPGADALASALLGAAVGSAFHVISHLIGVDLGGTPAMDIPTFGVLTVVLAAAGVKRYREVHPTSR